MGNNVFLVEISGKHLDGMPGLPYLVSGNSSTDAPLRYIRRPYIIGPIYHCERELYMIEQCSD